MAQRPSTSVAVLSLREFYQIQLSVDCCWEMKMQLDYKLIQVCERLGSWLYPLKFISPYSYISNFYDPKTIGYFAPLKSSVRFKGIFVNLSCCRGSGTHEDEVQL